MPTDAEIRERVKRMEREQEVERMAKAAREPMTVARYEC